jgi:hypothetical protein
VKQGYLLIFSLVSSILVVFYKFFEWKIVEVLTPFLMPLLWLLVFGFFFVITFLTLMNLFKNKVWKPLAIQTVTILLWLFFPFTQIVLNIDFTMTKAEREKVVANINSGTLKPNVSHNDSLIHLPEKYNHLSKGGGEVVVEKKGDSYTILFFTFRGILDSFSGFVYSPNDQRPSASDFDGDYKEIERLDKNWYWVASY